MRLVIVGAGGTGGYFGAKLAKAGTDVTFLARGAHLKAIREHGIRIRSRAEGEWGADVRAVESLSREPPADFVLFCVKSFDTESAAEELRPVIAAGTGVLSLQNGVDNEDKIARILGPGHVFGELDGDPSVRARGFAEACARAAIPVEIAANIRKVLWEKYLSIAPISGATSLTRLPVKFIREIPETRRLWQMQVDELLAIADAEGAGLDPDMRERCARFLDSLAPGNYSSLYQDLAQGKRLELDALHGYGIKRGEHHGIPTPVLFAVYAALKPYIDGKPVF